MIKKKLISFISLFILCVAILCGTTSCSSQKYVYSSKKNSGYGKVRNNKPKWNATQNSKQTKYIIKNKKKKYRPY